LANPAQDMNARDPSSGRNFVYEGRKEKVVDQLEFERDIVRVQFGQVKLLALEIEATAMLLL
jgi:hypothetical protein